ncbi:MAG: hypothetical protein AAF515_03055 [Pseudomonadota bacterium]
MRSLTKPIGFVSILLLATSAHAARQADLNVGVQAQSEVSTGAAFTSVVQVNNAGTRNARNVVTTVNLPASVLVLTAPANCGLSGSVATCTLNRLRKNHSISYEFELEAPPTAETLNISAMSTTTSREANIGNNSAGVAVAVVEEPDPEFIISAPVSMTAEACIGSIPLVWSQCTPGSLIAQALVLNGDNTVTTFNPAYEGTWQQTGSSDLTMTFVSVTNQQVAMVMTGQASSATCFQGTATYPQTGYFGAWQACTP